MASSSELKANYLTEWLNLSIALRNTSESAHAYVNKLREEGKHPDVSELPIIIPQIADPVGGKKRKAGDVAGDEDKPKTGKGSRGGKKPKDPNAPKRPPSAYINYQNSIREEMRTKFKDIPYNDLMKLIGESWNKLDQTTKDKWSADATKAMEKYKHEAEDYKAKGGIIDSPSPPADAPVVPPKTAKKDKKAAAALAAAATAPKHVSKDIVSSDDDDSSEDDAPVKSKAPARVESEESESEEEAVAPPPSKKTKQATPAKAVSKPASKVDKPKSSKEPKPDKADKSDKRKSSPTATKKEKKRKSQAAE